MHAGPQLGCYIFASDTNRPPQRLLFSLSFYSSENDLLYRVEDLRKPEDSEHDIRMTDYSMSDSGVRLI